MLETVMGGKIILNIWNLKYEFIYVKYVLMRGEESVDNYLKRKFCLGFWLVMVWMFSL